MSKRSIAIRLSPLSLLTISACGGGSTSNFTQSTAGSTSGRAFLGELDNALVYIDYDDASIADSATVRTDANGLYTLETLNNNYTIVVVTDGSTIDHSSGTLMSGVTLKARAGSTVVTAASTMMEESGLTVAQVQKILGLGAIPDFLTFDAYAAGADAGKALLVEKASTQIMAVVNSFAAAIEGSGASQTDAFNTALKAVSDVIKDKVVADPNTAWDLTDQTAGGDLDLVKDKVIGAYDDVGGITGATKVLFTNMGTQIVDAVGNVNTKVATATDLTSDTSKNIFSTTSTLTDQIKTAVTDGVAATITFTDSTKVDASALNKAPTDITLTASSISEWAGSLAIGTLGLTDDGVGPATGTITYAIAQVSGTDYARFSINQNTGVLSFTAQPDFEANDSLAGTSTYTVTILVNDKGGKIFAKALTVTVTDANDAPTVANAIADQTMYEDLPISFTFDSGVFADVDAGDTLTYTATINGSAVSINNTAFNAATRTFTGTALNADVGTHTVVVTATDSSGATVSDSFIVTIVNTNDAPTVANAIVDQTATVGTALSFQFNTNVFADVDVGDTFTYAATLSNGSALPSWLTFDAATRTFSGTPVDGHTGTIAVKVTATDTGSAVVFDTFNITVGTNNAPANIALSSNSVAENSAGVDIGTLSGTDAEGTTLTYSLASGGDNDYFEISGTKLKFKDGVSANYEVDNSLSITIYASDGTATTSLDTVINVTNVNEANASTHNAKADAGYSANGLNTGNDAAVENLMSGRFWGTAGEGIDLSYSFMTTSSSFKTGYSTGGPDHKGNVQNASAAFKAAVQKSFLDFSSVSLMNFTEVADNGSSVGHLRFGTTTIENGGFAYYPSSTQGGDIWLNSTNDEYNDANELKDGNYTNSTILHEIGHAIGFAHTQDASGNYGTGNLVGGVHNSMPYSLMAYPEYIGEDGNSGASGAGHQNSYSNVTTLMIDDIAALQHLYGVNEQYNTGNDVYTLGSFDDGTKNDNYIYASIWDAGGTDTISWDGQSTVASINLAAGGFCYFGDITGTDNVGLANATFTAGSGLLGIGYNVVIENAKGGSAIDTVVGNSAANILYGGAGSGIKDTLTGNGGIDTFVCSLSDAVTDASLADSITDFTNGTDLIGLEDRTWSNLTIVDSGANANIVDTASNKVLFVLESIDHALIDATDFVVTDFV